MRAYFFGNMYLSSIQQGIQAAHVTAELFCQYDGEEVYDGIQTPTGVLTEWANDHKTMILLNGGYLETMEDLWYFLDYTTDKPYPYAKFHEGLDSLGGVLCNYVVCRCASVSSCRAGSNSDWRRVEATTTQQCQRGARTERRKCCVKFVV